MTRFLRPSISALILICIAVLLVYYPGLNGPFVFDDTVNIVNNPYIAITQFDYTALRDAALGSSEQFGRPLAFLSFALNHLFAGNFANSFPFKLTNLAIHLINAILVYWLVTLMIRRLPDSGSPAMNFKIWLAVAVTAAWALHPLHLTSVLYVVQRMTSLAAFFVFAGLILFFYGRQRVQEQRLWGFPLMAAGWFVGLALGTVSKENAALLPLFMLIIEYFFFLEAVNTPATKTKLAAFYVLTVLTPLLLAGLWVILKPDFILDSYISREFTPIQRLLTEPRVLWFYLSLLVLPDIRRFTLYHDDIALSTGVFSPWTTLPALVGLLAAMTIAVVYRKKYPVMSFSIAWFLVGHSMESSIIGLEIAHEHRNYLPDIGPIFGLVYGVFKTFSRTAGRAWIIGFLLALPISALGAVTHLRAQIWSNESTLIEHMASNHSFSTRSQVIMGELLAYRKHDRLGALEHYRKAIELNPNETSYLIKMTVVTCDTRIGPTEPVTPIANTEISNLDNVFFDRIILQLTTYPPSPSTLASLRTLSQCVTEPPNHCRCLSQTALKWYAAALTNPYISGSVRSDIVTYIFNIGMWSGDYNLALETAKQGGRHDPENITYALMEAEAYIKLRRLGQAAKVLDSIAKFGSTLPKDARANIAILRSMIQKQRAAK